MKIAETPKFNISCLLILLVSLVSSLSVHAKDRDFTIFLNDLDTLLSDSTLEDEINNNKKSKIKPQKIAHKTIKPTLENSAIVPKTQNVIKKKITAHHIKCKKEKNQTNLVKRINKNSKEETNLIVSKKKVVKETTDTQTAYWDQLHFIESSAGKRLYRKRNKARSCKWTTTPCGHHQLSVRALKDIGCTSLKCRSAREDYKKSLSMSKKLAAINSVRMKKKGYETLPSYQRYLVHQQGAYGLGKILDAFEGKKTLSKKTLRYMANNSPFSYKTLRRASSKSAARKFLRFWKEKWDVKMSKRVASR